MSDGVSQCLDLHGGQLLRKLGKYENHQACLTPLEQTKTPWNGFQGIKYLNLRSFGSVIDPESRENLR
jgi:hypothetical protein